MRTHHREEAAMTHSVGIDLHGTNSVLVVLDEADRGFCVAVSWMRPGTDSSLGHDVPRATGSGQLTSLPRLGPDG